MTKNITSTNSPMSDELDLDSFLRRHNATFSDEDEEEQKPQSSDTFHRTIDDILNDSSSDSDHEAASLSSSTFYTKTLNSGEKEVNSTQIKFNLIQRLKSDEFGSRKPPIAPQNSLNSSIYGSGVSRKPGAALAAAAAASRNVRTPRSAMIMSRRASSEGLEGKVLDDELLGFVRDDVKSEDDNVNGVVGEGICDRENSGRGDMVMDSFERSGVKVCESSSVKEGVEMKKGDVEFNEASDEKGDGKLLNDEGLGRKGELVVSNDKSEISNVEVDSGGYAEKCIGCILDFEEECVGEKRDVQEEFVGKKKDVEEGVGSSLEVKNKEKEEWELGSVELGMGRDEASSASDDVENRIVQEDRIAQLEDEMNSERPEETLHPVKKPLELAEELEVKQASTGQDWEEGAAAQPMRLEGVRRGSTVLGYFDVNADNTISRAMKSQAFIRDYGTPQAIVVHLNYIALGMSKGVVVVVPSKYSAQRPDDMDSKMLLLGAQADRSHAPVTSICFNQQGDLLLAGYGDGHIKLWNVPRGTVAKVITGEHVAPVVHTLFLGQDSQVTRQFKAVTGDCKGLVQLHEFSSVPIIGVTVKTQCLLDGQRTGTVLCASPLLPDEFTFSENTTGSSSSIGSVMGGASPWRFFNEGSPLSEEGVVIFVTHQTALVVRLTPSLEVYTQLSKPEGVREGSMPYTAWKCTTQPRASSTENVIPEALERISLLAIAWDRKVQVTKLVKSELKESGKVEPKESGKWTLKVCGKWTLESAAVGLAWLDDQMLVILTLAGQLCLFTKDGNLIHQTTYATNEIGEDDFMSCHTYFTNVYGNPEKAYHNSLAVRGASVYILAPRHVVVSRLLLWQERIEVLRNAGDWMGAFNMAMTLYDGQTHGVIDLPRDLHTAQEAIMPYLVELLFSYVDEVFSYISVACFNQTGKVEEVDDSLTKSISASSEIKEQFSRVGGVAVEFCVHIKRTDILFNQIFSKFVAVQHRDTFLELLEPYILKDMLGSLPPEIMQALVEHYNYKGWLQRVEQCVLHMDISSLDFNQVVRLCRENGLYGALIYLFNKGLDDFKTPLEELLSVLRNHEREAAVGYRMLVYLKYCFSGLAFPPGHGKLPSERLPSLRMELLLFLLQDSGGPKSQTSASLTSTGSYLNLHYLLELDTEATLDVLRKAFVEDEHKLDQSLPDSSDTTVDDLTNSDSGNQNLLIQKTVDALVIVLDIGISQSVRSAGSDDTGVVLWPSKKDIGQLIEFIASYVASKRATVSKSVLSQMLEHLTSENYLEVNEWEQNCESKKKREKKVLALLDVVPQTEWNTSYVLHLCEKAQFHQVCGQIHNMRNDYFAALDSYMKDADEPVLAFSFIDCILLQLSESESVAFQSTVISRIPELVILSRECTFCLVSYHLNKERGLVFSKLRSTPRSLFLYLKTLFEVYFSGCLNFSSIRVDNVLDGPWDRKNDRKNSLDGYLKRIAEFPKFIRSNPVEVTDDIIELYLELLCQYEPDSVLKFLDTCENYRVDRCLLLCQQYGIVDAAAFLLERVGDVGTALSLTLSGLNDKFNMLDTVAGRQFSDMDVGKRAYMEHVAAASELKEVQDIRKILNACIGLCQRNSPRLDPEEAESLWFYLLDSFCKPLLIPQGSSENSIPTQSLSYKDDLEVNAITWRVHQTQKCALILKGLFSQFVKEIVEGMIGYVRLPSIMAKLLSDNGSQEFGDFKLTILGMLGTYSFERKILDTAKCLIEDDTFYTMSLLKKGASKGYAPRSLQCCICNCTFKSSSSSGIRVFNCGHASHIQCDVQENFTSTRSFSGGCPICVQKKKMHKAKGKMIEQGLVAASPPSSSQRAQSTSIMHSHEFDAFEISTGSQISRFEILSSLQKNQRLIPNDTMPQLRLAPPAVYHEKVNKRTHYSSGPSRDPVDVEKPSRNRQLRDHKVKGSPIRFPLKSKIFGKEKTRVS